MPIPPDYEALTLLRSKLDRRQLSFQRTKAKAKVSPSPAVPKGNRISTKGAAASKAPATPSTAASSPAAARGCGVDSDAPLPTLQRDSPLPTGESHSGAEAYLSLLPEDEGVASVGPLKECPQCNRQFNPESLARHMKICKKVFAQKRKPFDAAVARVADVEGGIDNLRRQRVEEKKFQKKSAKKKDEKSGGGGGGGDIPAWKAKSEAFRNAMKAARNPNDPSLQVPSLPDPTLTPCPHCGRTFNPDAAARHIPLCAKKHAGPVKPQPKAQAKRKPVGKR